MINYSIDFLNEQFTIIKNQEKSHDNNYDCTSTNNNDIIIWNAEDGDKEKQ